MSALEAKTIERIKQSELPDSLKQFLLRNLEIDLSRMSPEQAKKLAQEFGADLVKFHRLIGSVFADRPEAGGE
ncbi:hypothetical protein JW752_02510 [Candidatus Peregrinibacteria bacterium]|nr:hypothetical protein [Candidatus Peregrinibacteria bacterium]